MHIVIKEWKTTPINLQTLETHLRATYSTYLGNSAHKYLELYFSEQPSELELADINAFWDLLDGSDYKSSEQLKLEEQQLEATILAMKESILSKTWDTISAVEKKVAMNMKVTRTEMGL